uniref:Transposase zinc-ribbon domain-containing protein n=1 Tax=Desulfobacca acetoxidans TaxID=60893 RepID=A0A7C3WIM6_9BACT
MDAKKALSLRQFQKKFGTEKVCQKYLFRLRWPKGFRCPAANRGDGHDLR